MLWKIWCMEWEESRFTAVLVARAWLMYSARCSITKPKVSSRGTSPGVMNSRKAGFWERRMFTHSMGEAMWFPG